MDVEFVTQFLVLRHGRKFPTMLENRGNIALLERADDLGMLPAPVGHAAAAAYRELRKLQHRARLNEESTAFPEDMMPPACGGGAGPVAGGIWAAAPGLRTCVSPAMTARRVRAVCTLASGKSGYKSIQSND